ncbi:ATP synthase subunit b, mitochondrial [Lamellibrachia satsuma]|nr:ATP synthase subunit b, mitochondrial [Lamellibrachia satsuma]
MLSRLALRSGAFAPVLRFELQKRAAVVVVSRSSSGTNKVIEDWDRANKLYYGPERDLKNFPPPVQAENPPPVRMGCIPDSWFQFFYEKTGVTGPYMFGVGTLTFLLSKEIWVIEHGFMEFITFWLMFAILNKKLGPGIAKYFDTQTELWRAKYWDGPMAENKKTAGESVADIEKAIWREDGQKYMFEAKKENVDLQLEAIYRQRLAEVSQAIKSRLNYQMDMEGTKRRFEQKHMVNWIVDSVVKGITPDQEKQTLLKCIEDLNKLSTKAAA